MISLPLLMGHITPPPVTGARLVTYHRTPTYAPVSDLEIETARRRADIARWVCANAPVSTEDVAEWADIDAHTAGGDLRSCAMMKRIRKLGRTSKGEGQHTLWGAP